MCDDLHAHDSGARAVDDSAWDGSAALSACAKSSTPATCYGSICAGRKSGSADQQSTWALPHHKTAGGPPNAAGVRAALARISQTQGLTNASEARKHLEAHLASIQSSQSKSGRPPRDSLIRGVFPLELRVEADDGSMPTLYGHFAVFNRWTEIDSLWEGQFMESIAPGAFKKTFSENRANMRVLFQHGKDPAIGDKVLGPIEDLREDKEGAYYEVPLLDTSYNRDLLPGLERGLYGASFRFSVMKESINQNPERSERNPDGLPERTIQEVALREFGPVTWPAYTDATAGVRSLTDEFIVRQLVGDPERLQALLHQHDPTALSRPGAEPAHSAAGEPQPKPRWPQVTREEFIGTSGSGRTPFDP